MKKYHYLYKITHIESERIYLGIHSTNDMNDRYFANGIYESKVKNNAWSRLNHGDGKHTHMRSALIKYGRSAFKKEIIKTFKNRKAALKEEKKLVTREFINRDDNFNHRTGGEGNLEFSKEVRKKISKNNPMQREDVRKKVAEAQKKSWTKERRKEMSKNNPMKNPEIAEKLSGENSVWFGRKHTDETKKKISNANTGTVRTKEQIESQRKSLKEYWSNPKRVSKRKDMSGIKKPKNFGPKITNNWKKKIEIKDKSSGKIYNSLREIQILLSEEGLDRTLGTISEYINGKKGKRIGLDKRFIYLKNPKNKNAK